MKTVDKANANYRLVTDMAKKLDDLKGFTAAYSLPSSGMMMLQHGGYNFLITAEVLSSAEEVKLGDELNRNKFRFTTKVEEQEKQIVKEKDEENGYV